MFTIQEVNDKYKILYLDDGIKNKFMSLLLIGLDDKYMKTDLKTLNETVMHYKEKLNKRCQKEFKTNFNLNTKSHLRFLADICQVNLTIRDLEKNLNKYSMNGYKKTIYFVNNGNEYGLVLKNNKKSMNTALPKSDLTALEQLSLEGGVNGKPPSSQQHFVPSSPPLSPSSQQQFVPPSPPTSTSPSPSSPPFRSSSPSPSKLQQSEDNILQTILDPNTKNEVRECLYKCYVNELTEEYKIYFNDKLNEKALEKMKEFENNGIDSDRFLKYIIKKFNPYNQDRIQREAITPSPAPAELDNNIEHTRVGEEFDNLGRIQGKAITPSPAPAELDNNIVHTRVGIKKIKKIDISEDFFREKFNSIDQKNIDFLNNLKRDVISKAELDIMLRKYDGDYEDENDIVQETFEEKSNIQNRYGAGFISDDLGMEGGTRPASAAHSITVEDEDMINQLEIKDLLESGIDSFHDFSKKITGNDTKREILEHFIPGNVEDYITYVDGNEEIVANVKDSVNQKWLLTVLTEAIFNRYNTKICEGYNIKPLSINYSPPFPFVPRISRIREITNAYNPFDKSWEKKSNLIYLGSSAVPIQSTLNPGTGYHSLDLDKYINSVGKKIIIFSDANKGSSFVFASFLSNIDFSFPDNFYNSIDAYYETIEKTGVTIKTFFDNLQQNMGIHPGQYMPSGSIPERDKIKSSYFNFFRESLYDSMVSSEHAFHFNTPASIMDGFNPTGTYKNMDELRSVFDKINKDIGSIFNIVQRNPPPLTNVHGMPIAPAYRYYKLLANTGGVGGVGGTQIDILNNTYEDHFKKISQTQFRTTNPNPHGGIQYYEIKFDFYLGESPNDDTVCVIIRMRYHKMNRQTGMHTGNFGEEEIVFKELGQINKLLDPINLVYSLKKNDPLHNNDLTNMKDINYEKIYRFLKKFREHTKVLVKNKNNKDQISAFPFSTINTMFLRILYTFKMIGDHGQVKFIKALKEIPEFSQKFEVLFTSEDSLALLYANVNHITNMTMREGNFPSDYYCQSNPRGMIFYPS